MVVIILNNYFIHYFKICTVILNNRWFHLYYILTQHAINIDVRCEPLCLRTIANSNKIK